VRVEEMLGGGFYRWRGEERGRGRGGGAAHQWTAIDGLVARCAVVSGEGRGRGRVGRRRLSAWRTRGEGEEARGGEGAPGIGRPARPGRWSGWLELEDGPDRWAPPVSGVREREREVSGWLS
jgi:hypothetical protein